jgi:hypothetical protein
MGIKSGEDAHGEGFERVEQKGIDEVPGREGYGVMKTVIDISEALGFRIRDRSLLRDNPSNGSDIRFRPSPGRASAGLGLEEGAHLQDAAEELRGQGLVAVVHQRDEKREGAFGPEIVDEYPLSGFEREKPLHRQIDDRLMHHRPRHTESLSALPFRGKPVPRMVGSGKYELFKTPDTGFFETFHSYGLDPRFHNHPFGWW